MSETEKESSREKSFEEEVPKNLCGLILGFWDHEKTPTLIEDLEHSINLVEKKCVKLFEELKYYKKYLEESEETDFHLAVVKKKIKKSKNSHFCSGSEPDIAFRKNLINVHEIQQVLEENFQEKLYSINKELTEAALKLGIKNSIILFPTNDYLETLNAQIEDEAGKNCDIREKFINQNFLKSKTKSDSVIIKQKKEVGYSKITKTDLELYQKLSRLSVTKRNKKNKLKGMKIKFSLKRETSRCRKDSLSCKAQSKRPKSRKIINKKKLNRLMVPEKNESRSPRESLSTIYSIHSAEKNNELEAEKIYKVLTKSFSRNNLSKSVNQPKAAAQEPAADEKFNLGAAIRKAVPFTTCASTSRSFNIGLNLQQLFSLSKHRRSPNVKIITSDKTNAHIKIQNVKSSGTISSKRIPTDTEKGTEFLPPSDSKINGFEAEEINHLEHKKKFWISEHSESSNFRKVRSRYTGRSPEGFVEYYKSTMSQFTSGRNSMIKSESKSAYAVGSKIMLSDIQRTDVFEIGSDCRDICFENASGDGICNEICKEKLNREWAKVYGSFLNIYRKYMSLKEKLKKSELTLINGDLKSLEHEIDCSVEKYKNFLQFYSKFLHLNHRLKSLKIACEAEMLQPETSFSSNFNRKLFSQRPTNIEALKRAFREVQNLQDKIKLINV